MLPDAHVKADLSRIEVFHRVPGGPKFKGVQDVQPFAAHFGLISMSTADVAMPILGVPFLILAVVEIWLAFRALQDYLRMRRSGA